MFTCFIFFFKLDSLYFVSHEGSHSLSELQFFLPLWCYINSTICYVPCQLPAIVTFHFLLNPLQLGFCPPLLSKLNKPHFWKLNDQFKMLFLSRFWYSCSFIFSILEYSRVLWYSFSWVSFFLSVHSSSIYLARIFPSSKLLKLMLLSSILSPLVIYFRPVVLNAIYILVTIKVTFDQISP